MMYGITYGQAKSNMPHQLFQSWGHNKGSNTNVIGGQNTYNKVVQF